MRNSCDHDNMENTEAFAQAIAFRTIMRQRGDPQEYIIDTEDAADIYSPGGDSSSKTIMIMMREKEGFMIFNMRNETIKTKFTLPKGLDGDYRQLENMGSVSGGSIIIEQGATPPLSIPARSAVFFIKKLRCWQA